jgi:NRAMP (natural resistance-associated macrophage protein)-like metal ion transporter
MAKFSMRARNLWKVAGPGIITGAADDDPSGIATYTQTGAQFGYGQLWTALLILPMLVAVQEACARIGAVTGKGIAAVVKEHYSKSVLYSMLVLIVVANTINLGADLGAMGAAAELIIPANFTLLVLLFTAAILILEIFTGYKTYARILKWLAVSLFSYVITVFLVDEPWRVIFYATFVPHIEFTAGYFYIITGVIGTTISPYMFFWEASEEVEEEKSRHMIHNGVPKLTSQFMKRIRLDNFLGMLSSQIAAWCVIAVGSTVLHANGVTHITSAAQAAKALEPLVHSFPHSGFLAELIFAVGIIGLGFLAVPVFSGSASYALSEALHWNAGLMERRPEPQAQARPWILRCHYRGHADRPDDQLHRHQPHAGAGGHSSHQRRHRSPIDFSHRTDCPQQGNHGRVPKRPTVQPACLGRLSIYERRSPGHVCNAEILSYAQAIDGSGN